MYYQFEGPNKCIMKITCGAHLVINIILVNGPLNAPDDVQ